jgi:DNA-binding GntR family transcriptional regulator
MIYHSMSKRVIMARRPRQQPVPELQLIPAPRASASETVYEALREAILTRELPGGTPLIEAQLARQFNVSKTPIREALQRLGHGGLVDYELARGATVHTLTAQEIQDVFEMRVLLEPLAVQQSIPRLKPQHTEILEDTLLQAQQALQQQDYKQLSLLNSRFHQTLYSQATNHLLLRWLDSLSDLRRLITMHGWALENRSAREWEEHHAIWEAAQNNDVPLAVDCLTRHIQRFSQLVLEHMQHPNLTTES